MIKLKIQTNVFMFLNELDFEAKKLVDNLRIYFV